MLKQLKYFTWDVETIKKAQYALEVKGFDKSRLKIFSRECSDRSLEESNASSLGKKNSIPQESALQKNKFSMSVLTLVGVSCLGSIALSAGLIGFPGLAALVFLGYFLVHTLKFMGFSGRRSAAEPRKPVQAYYLVIDVDAESEKIVSRIAARLQGLKLQ